MSSGAAPAELVTIGTELLLGETIDTNAAWIGARLARAGFRLSRRTTVPDDVGAIQEAVREALERAPIVLCSGGLGPTSDDLTRPAVAGLLEQELSVDHTLLEALRERLRSRGLVMAESNRVQAEVPAGAVVFPNSRGTAPGLALEAGHGRWVILLPGVPNELRALVDTAVLPFLAARGFQGRQPVLSRVLRTTGIPESSLAERLEGVREIAGEISLAFLPSTAGVDLRFTSWGGLSPEAAATGFDDLERWVRGRLGRHLYGRDRDDLAAVVGALLRSRGWQLAIAESCTGGHLTHRLTAHPGASDFLTTGWIAYSDRAKTDLLSVAADTIERHGAVSEPTVRAMLAGAIRNSGAQAGLAVTGIAGPAGGSPEKPVGTVWFAARAAGEDRARCVRFPGSRIEVQERSAQAALFLLYELMQ